MAATYTDNGGSVDGSNKVFTYSFPVLQTEDIQVALNGVTQAQNRYTPSLDPPKITFHNSNGVDSTVQEADSAPKNGVTVRVYRKTTVGKASGDEDPKAVFAAGSSIRAGDLNANVEQALFGIHELQEQQVQTESIADGAVNSTKILDDTIVNADVNTSAAIAGTKISPNFGSQNISTTGSASTGALGVTGNITVSGTVDGRDVATDGSKLDGLEAGATGDQTAGEIRTLVESASDSNVFTDADHSKLNAIEASATADQTAAEIRTLVESASDSNVFTDADHAKLNAIDANATADQTASEIRTLVESASDSNVFTDADHTKLNGIEASADVTDATNVDAAGAVMNTDLGTKGQIIVGGTTPTILPVGTNNHVLIADSNEASGVKWGTTPAGSGLSNIVEDTTPQLGGDLDVNGNDIVSTSNGSINITPNGSGDVVIDGLKYPQADGSAGQFLKTNGSAQLSWSTVPAGVGGATGVDFNDDVKARWGTGNDLEIYHAAGADSHIVAPSGTLKISADNFMVSSHDSSGRAIYINDTSGHLELGFDGTHDATFNGGSITLFTDTTLNAQKDLRFADADSSNYVALQAPATIASNVTWTLPAADGSANQVLKTGGDGTLSWVNQSAGTITALNNQAANRLTTIGSTTTQLDGEASLTFEDTTSTGLISGKQITGRGFECPATVSDDWTIAAGNNAFFPGPMTVAANKTVTVPANRTLTIV